LSKAEPKSEVKSNSDVNPFEEQPVKKATESVKKLDDVAAAFDDLFNS
jgi:hypothetical protein